MDEVYCIELLEFSAERPVAGKGGHNLPLPTVALLLQILEELGSSGVGSGSAHENSINVAGPLVDCGGDPGDAAQEQDRVWFCEQRDDGWTVFNCDRLVVARNRHVKKRLEDPDLGSEEPVDGRRRDLGEIADGLERGRRVAAFQKERPGGRDDCLSSETGASLPDAPRRACSLDTFRHGNDSNTLNSGTSNARGR